jgi:hypothetical protein
MTRDDIALMAREAWKHDCFSLWQKNQLESLVDFANLVAAAEREACAKVCMDMWNDWINAPQGKQRDMPNNAQDCAFAIRERGAP